MCWVQTTEITAARGSGWICRDTWHSTWQRVPRSPRTCHEWRQVVPLPVRAGRNRVVSRSTWPPAGRPIGRRCLCPPTAGGRFSWILMRSLVEATVSKHAPVSHQNVSPWTIRPGRNDHGIDMTSLYLNIAGPIKSFPIRPIESPPRKAFPHPGRQFVSPGRPPGGADFCR